MELRKTLDLYSMDMFCWKPFGWTFWQRVWSFNFAINFFLFLQVLYLLSHLLLLSVRILFWRERFFLDDRDITDKPNLLDQSISYLGIGIFEWWRSWLLAAIAGSTFFNGRENVSLMGFGEVDDERSAHLNGLKNEESGWVIDLKQIYKSIIYKYYLLVWSNRSLLLYPTQNN